MENNQRYHLTLHNIRLLKLDPSCNRVHEGSMRLLIKEFVRRVYLWLNHLDFKRPVLTFPPDISALISKDWKMSLGTTKPLLEDIITCEMSATDYSILASYVNWQSHLEDPKVQKMLKLLPDPYAPFYKMLERGCGLLFYNHADQTMSVGKEIVLDLLPKEKYLSSSPFCTLDETMLNHADQYFLKDPFYKAFI